jgi:WD40 repeat protein|eukprot:SAG25_NODE_520_length_7225_cov_3.754420_4_plen_121_part_00
MRSHINCLLFDPEGKRLYTGDGVGDVKIWNCSSTGSDRHTSFSCQHTISGDQRAVNCLRLNPNGRRLLVHSRNNQLRTIETKSFVEYKRYSGLRNERLMVKSDISPDGRYIVSGSEDGQV